MSFSSDNPLLSNQLEISIDFPPVEDKDFLNMLSLTYKRVADSMNTKEGALYLLQELATFKQYFTQGNPQINRNVYRKTFDLVNLNGGNIAGGATVNFPHGITGLSSAALIYAGCTSVDPKYFSVMYPNIYLDATNIWFVNPLGTVVTQCYAVCEYLKN